MRRAGSGSTAGGTGGLRQLPEAGGAPLRCLPRAPRGGEAALSPPRGAPGPRRLPPTGKGSPGGGPRRGRGVRAWLRGGPPAAAANATGCWAGRCRGGHRGGTGGGQRLPPSPVPSIAGSAAGRRKAAEHRGPGDPGFGGDPGGTGGGPGEGGGGGPGALCPATAQPIPRPRRRLRAGRSGAGTGGGGGGGAGTGRGSAAWGGPSPAGPAG